MKYVMNPYHRTIADRTLYFCVMCKKYKDLWENWFSIKQRFHWFDSYMIMDNMNVVIGWKDVPYVFTIFTEENYVKVEKTDER